MFHFAFRGNIQTEMSPFQPMPNRLSRSREGLEVEGHVFMRRLVRKYIWAETFRGRGSKISDTCGDIRLATATQGRRPCVCRGTRGRTKHGEGLPASRTMLLSLSQLWLFTQQTAVELCVRHSLSCDSRTWRSAPADADITWTELGLQSVATGSVRLDVEEGTGTVQADKGTPRAGSFQAEETFWKPSLQ